MNTAYLRELNEYLSAFVTERRLEKIHRVLADRHRYLSVVLEDIYQPHNASAVLRSCDAFGVQDVHIIENRNEYRINPDVELGTAQWLSIHRYRRQEHNTAEAVASLRQRGYRIVATAPHRNDCLLEDLPLEPGPIALMFGTELTGLSDEAMALADEYVRIPMHGFVESYNISVSAALSLYELNRRLRGSQIPFSLTDDERQRILHDWLAASIKKSDALEAEFRRSRDENP
jgi:tRNA (guanosine-2'-O-)-methyltransferase